VCTSEMIALNGLCGVISHNMVFFKCVLINFLIKIIQLVPRGLPMFHGTTFVRNLKLLFNVLKRIKNRIIWHPRMKQCKGVHKRNEKKNNWDQV
jgi:hypothetical protein